MKYFKKCILNEMYELLYKFDVIWKRNEEERMAGKTGITMFLLANLKNVFSLLNSSLILLNMLTGRQCCAENAVTSLHECLNVMTSLNVYRYLFIEHCYLCPHYSSCY